MQGLRPCDFFADGDDLDQLFDGAELVWDVLPRLADLTRRLSGRTSPLIRGTVMEGAHIGSRDIAIMEGALVEPGAYIKGPAYIGPDVVVRHGAYVRENCIFLRGSVLGHASEAKNSLFLPGAQAPHFAYVGDSVLGRGVNLGAGTKLSNLPLELNDRRTPIRIVHDGVPVETGLVKMGAILGDGVETGCNVVTNPGVLIGPRSFVYPGLVVQRGLHPGGSLVKLRQEVALEPLAVRRGV